jgi:hypothetical protein
MHNFTQSVKGDIQRVRSPELGKITIFQASKATLDWSKAQIRICEASLVHSGPLIARPKSYVYNTKTATSPRTVALSIPSHRSILVTTGSPADSSLPS